MLLLFLTLAVRMCFGFVLFYFDTILHLQIIFLSISISTVVFFYIFFYFKKKNLLRLGKVYTIK